MIGASEDKSMSIAVSPLNNEDIPVSFLPHVGPYSCIGHYTSLGPSTPRIISLIKWRLTMISIQLKLKVVVGVCNYVIFLANIFK